MVVYVRSVRLAWMKNSTFLPTAPRTGDSNMPWLRKPRPSAPAVMRSITSRCTAASVTMPPSSTCLHAAAFVAVHVQCRCNRLHVRTHAANTRLPTCAGVAVMQTSPNFSKRENTAHLLPAGLELGLDEGHQLRGRRHECRHRRQHREHRDEGQVQRHQVRLHRRQLF